MDRSPSNRKDLPVEVTLSGDNNDFEVIEDALKLVFKRVRVKEVGFAGYYIGMAYEGNLKDHFNARLLQELKTKVAGWDG